MCPTDLNNFLSTELYFQLVTEPTTKPTTTKSSTMPSTSTASTGDCGTGNTIQSHIFNFILLVKQPNLSRYLSFIFGENVTAKNNFSWSSGCFNILYKKSLTDSFLDAISSQSANLFSSHSNLRHVWLFHKLNL